MIMNTIIQTNVNYLHPSRTMEVLLIKSGHIIQEIFIYNYEGIHFRVFENQKEANKFLNGDSNAKTITEFIDENELDSFLQKVAF